MTKTEAALKTGDGAQSAPFALLERRGRVAIVTLDRPASRNALSVGMLTALMAQIDALSGDAEAAAVVITGNGPALSAGHDLRELTAHRSDPDQGCAFTQSTMTLCASLMQKIVACPKPVIAAVEGIATAAGCQLVATCDLAVAGTSARFATPGVNIGLFCSTPMVALTRNLSRKHAMEMLLLGEMVHADKAAEIGLINRVVPDGEALNEAVRMAEQIAAKSSVTVAIGKRAFYTQAEQSLADAYAFTSEVMVRNMLERDAVEGIGAFLDKRQPNWG